MVPTEKKLEKVEQKLDQEPLSAEVSVPAQKSEKASIPYMQNRELSWLDFDARVLDQGADDSVPLLQRLNFVSIFWSNLQEFFMVRVGSLTDLSLLKKDILDSKTGMTPAEQLMAVYQRVGELYPVQESVFQDVRAQLADKGVTHAELSELNAEQREFLNTYARANVLPFLSPQIINSRHPFPHLENGALYVLVRLHEPQSQENAEPAKKAKGKKAKSGGADGVMLGLIPMPRQCSRVVKLPGKGFTFVLLEQVVEMLAEEVFSMYNVKHTNVICVTRNADLDPNEGVDESDEDYREHMKRILKRRGRLAAVRLESKNPLSENMRKVLSKRLNLKPHQMYSTSVPLDLSYTWGLPGFLTEKKAAALTYPPFTPQWPACLDRNRSIMEQVRERDVLLSYPYESMDPFVMMLREAVFDPQVTSIKITLYRLASQSHLAEALIAAAENGKEVTALFELRARFDENNNIEWSQRFEEAGANVIYGFRDYKVHSKICCITRQTPDGPEYITQLGTGNYNEKTAKLYTDLSYMTANPVIGRDATEFFRNMALENTSDAYGVLSVAPLQIKAGAINRIDQQIQLAKEGKPCGLFFKTNSVTDKDMILKIVEASQAGVPTILFVRGISCIVPRVEGYTDNVRVVSIVGRLLEHSRIYGFGPWEDMTLYLSSADLMTRNMDKRIEIAWPILDDRLRAQIMDYLNTFRKDTAKLRELCPDGSFTPLRARVPEGEEPLDSQELLIRQAQERMMARAHEDAQRTMTSFERAMENTKTAREKTGKTVQVKEHEHLAEKAKEGVNGVSLPSVLGARDVVKEALQSRAKLEAEGGSNAKAGKPAEAKAVKADKTDKATKSGKAAAPAAGKTGGTAAKTAPAAGDGVFGMLRRMFGKTKR